MSDTVYKSLMEDLARATQIADVASLVEHGQLLVNDVQFSLYASADARLLVYCDFGVPPSDRRAEALTAVLEMNLFMFDGTGPTFAINPESGHLIFADHYALKDLNGDLLSNILAKLAQNALDWRQTFFLDTPATEASAPAASRFNKSTRL